MMERVQMGFIKARFLLPIVLALHVGGLLADVSVGKQIFQHCKNCQTDFKHRKRINKPMVPVFKNWRFNQDAIASVAAYVTQLPTAELNIPAYEPAAEMLAQFDSREEMEEVGEDIFQDCIQCHGEKAAGKTDKETPPLVKQYSNYLRKQIGDFATGRRVHENSESLFAELEADEVEALLAYISKLVTAE
jgi:cytochrome c553